jgi:phenylacetate-CoA ligase
VIADDGSEATDGEPGSVIISNLLSRGSVFLNYRIGDRSRKVAGPCPCGRNLPQIALVDDRLHDWLMAPDGSPVRPAMAVKAIELVDGVLGFQLRQQDLLTFAVDVILRPDRDREEVLRRLETAVREQLDPRVVVRARAVQDLPRTPGGKVHSVVGIDSARR